MRQVSKLFVGGAALAWLEDQREKTLIATLA